MDISTNPPTALAGTASCSINLGSVLGAGFHELLAMAKSWKPLAVATLPPLRPHVTPSEPDDTN